jgi:hypothetical protein
MSEAYLPRHLGGHVASTDLLRGLDLAPIHETRSLRTVLNEFAAARIRLYGSQTPQQLVRALPAPLRKRVAAADRSRDITGTVERLLANALDVVLEPRSGKLCQRVCALSDRPILISAIALDPERRPAAFCTEDGDVLSLDVVRDMLSSGFSFVVNGKKRQSRLVYVDGVFRSGDLDEYNDDLARLPRR